MVEIPHVSWPLRFDRGRVITVDQDSAQHIAECVEAATRTEQGWRIEAPDFGIPNYLLSAGGADLDGLRAALVASEPRAEVIADLVEHGDDLRAQHIRLLIEEA